MRARLSSTKLSNLLRLLRDKKEQIKNLPHVAARKMVSLVRQGQIAQKAPDGTLWAPTKVAHTQIGTPDKNGRLRDKNGRFLMMGVHGLNSFDPERHIQYEAIETKDSVKMVSSHRAAGYTRFGTRKMPARAKVPGRRGPGWWMPKIHAALRGYLRRKGVK